MKIDSCHRGERNRRPHARRWRVTVDPPIPPPVVDEPDDERRVLQKLADRWSEQMLNVPKSKLSLLMKMGDKILSLLKINSK